MNAIQSTLTGSNTPVQNAEAVKDAFTDFIGKTFFGVMLKAMRSTTGEAAYFHGGQAEEMFRSQLDQQMADELTESSAAQIADPLFERQFPQYAKVLQSQTKTPGQPKNSLESLDALRRF